MSDVFDRPIAAPDGDLLDMNHYAEKLAEFIARVTAPFTIGIYGEWGTGKTSFVRLVQHFLMLPQIAGASAIHFIEFSAWQHKTADELWRALIMAIARDLYGIQPVEDAPSADGGLLGKLSTLLASDALVLRETDIVDPSVRERREYHEFAARLGRTLKGSISRTPAAPQLDPESLVAAIAKLSLSAASTMSPLVAGVRKLLGLEVEVKPDSLLRRGRDELAADRIESMDEFVGVFNELLDKRASGKRVCVFIDDLDRCMPDAALDLLEAIRLFLGNTRCIFIVAADEHLISHGLRMRFRAIGTRDDGGGRNPAANFISIAKGREYFEKIIQLSIRVPHRMYEQIHRLISAQFPQWAPASDIIHAAVGNNPRRAKQYCTWLTYKYEVASSLPREATEGAPSDAEASRKLVARRRSYELFNKIVELCTWHQPCAKLLGALTREPEAYQERMRELEAALGTAEIGRPDAAVRGKLSDERLRQLYDFAVAWRPLLELFRNTSPPTLSTHDASDVAVLLGLAAVRPDRERMLSVDDAPFQRIAGAIAYLGSTDADHLLGRDLAWWILIVRKCPAIAADLAQLAVAVQASGSGDRRGGEASPDAPWRRQMAEREVRLSGVADDDDSLSPEVRALYDSTSDDARAVLRQERFSAMLRQEILAFSRLARPEDLPPSPLDLISGFTEAEIARAIADVAWSPRPGSSPPSSGWTAPPGFRDAMNRARADFKLRVDIAEQLLLLRTFAKLDALAHGWPELSQMLRTPQERSALKAFETQTIQPQPAQPLDERFARYSNDERLLQLLPLRPLYRDIHPHDIALYFQVAQSLVQPGGGDVPVAERPAPGARFEYDDVVIELTQKVGPLYEMVVEHDRKKIPREVNLNLKEIVDGVSRLSTVGREPGPMVVTREVVGAAPLGELLREIGTQTYQTLFPEDQEHWLLPSPRTDRNLRIAWVQKADRGDHPLADDRELASAGDRDVGQRTRPDLAVLPWECLYLPPVGPFLGLNRQYSLVRYLRGSIARSLPSLQAPLRMLVVMCSPPGTPPLNLDGELATLRSTIGDPGRVTLRVLRDGEATYERLQDCLRVFRPQLLHCVAHGFHAEESHQGALMLFDPGTKRGTLVTASQLGPLLGGSSVQLAVLNSCDTGRSTFGDAVSGVAGALVGNGTPAVIATTRKVLDDAAIMFTREFYRAFFDGYPLEASFVEARTALNGNNWDWAAYALIVGTLALDGFMVGSPRPR